MNKVKFKISEEELRNYILLNKEKFIPISSDTEIVEINNKTKAIISTVQYLYDLKNEKFISLNIDRLKKFNLIY